MKSLDAFIDLLLNTNKRIAKFYIVDNWHYIEWHYKNKKWIISTQCGLYEHYDYTFSVYERNNLVINHKSQLRHNKKVIDLIEYYTKLTMSDHIKSLENYKRENNKLTN